MKIARFFDASGEVCYGAVAPDGALEALDGDLFGGFSRTGRPAAEVRRLAPLDPANIFCIGLNYREHAKESNSPIPEEPVVFMKPTTAACGPGDPIRIPACCLHGPEVDYECELAVVVGRTARNVTADDALDHVLGYTVGNDVSARKWQRRNGGQWVRGKSFDTFCPLGPVLLTADELPDPQAALLRTTLNGDVMQRGCAEDMIFTVAELVSFLSRDTTLLPGTVILTGTPPGVGFARTPPVFLKPGDVVTVEIEQIGALTNPVAAG